MKNQMKKLTALLCAAAALISLSACGNNNEAETAEDTTQSISDAASQDEITTQGDITAVPTQSDETTEAQTESLTDGKTENTSAAKDSAAKASDKEKTTAKKSEAAKTTASEKPERRDRQQKQAQKVDLVSEKEETGQENCSRSDQPEPELKGSHRRQMGKLRALGFDPQPFKSAF